MTIILNTPGTRLRIRRVDEHSLAEKVAADAEKGWRALCTNGGAVANCYGYRADTEAALAVRDPQGRVVVWMARLAANKVTSCGSANACLPGTGAIWDGRIPTGSPREAAAWAVIKAAHLYETARRTPAGAVVEALSGHATLRQLDEATLTALAR